MPRPTVKSPLRLTVAVLLGILALYVFASYLVDTFGVQIDPDAKAKPQNSKTETKHRTQLEEFLYDTLVEGKYTVVIFETKFGNIEFGMLNKHAPNTAAHFIKLAEEKVFKGGALYRAEPGFVLQGGVHGKKNWNGSPIKLEYKVPNYKGTVSMARTSDPHSATTEFAIQLGDNSRWLGPGGADEYGYGVFAVIVNGWDAIETIMKQPARKNGGTTMLNDAVMIDDVLVEERDVPGSR